MLRAAKRLFASKGYAATTVRDVLREAGVTAPVLYYHFGNKEGVFLALAREAREKIDAAVEAALGRGATASERIRGYCRAIAAVRRDDADLVRIADSILSGPPEAAPRFDIRSAIAETVRRLETLVRQGIESGELRPCDARSVALALLGAVEIAARPVWFTRGKRSCRDPLDRILSVILQGLAGSSAPRGGGRRRP